MIEPNTIVAVGWAKERQPHTFATQGGANDRSILRVLYFEPSDLER